ncbi:MAG: ABC transporter ATP-binding protein [Dehalococcoidia bacterium]
MVQTRETPGAGGAASGKALLRLDSIQAYYGPVQGLQNVSLEVAEGSVVAVLGANGAGKSTTLRCISGVMHPSAGTIEFDGRVINTYSPEQIVRLGISQVPEGRQVFGQLTVLENLRLGAYTRKDRAGVARDIERMYDYFPILKERQQQTAGTLSGGQQQMMVLARGLMARPRLLLLDEPSLGLAPLVVREIFHNIQVISRDEKLTVLVVEQDASAALAVADYAYVLEVGRVALSGTAVSLREDEGVRRSYLGY